MGVLDNFRAKYPGVYDDMSDGDLATALHKKYYSDIPREEFDAKVQLKATPTPPQAGFAEDVGRGIVKGLHDVPAGGAQLLTRGLEGIAPAGSWFENYMRGERERVEGINKQAETDYQKSAGPYSEAGRIAGGALASAPLAGGGAAGFGARMLAGVRGGALTGALQPVTEGDFGSKKFEQIGMGAAGGLGAAGIGAGTARVVSPQTAPEARSLIDRGVALTPGHLAGKTASRIEQGLESIPIVGDVIKGAKTRELESFNRVAINEALAPIGAQLPRNTEMGRPAVDAAHRMIGAQYDTLLPQLNVRADNQFAGNLQQLISGANNLEPAMREVFRNNLRDKVLHRFSQGGGMTGQGFKEMEGDLGKLASDYSSSSMAGERQLGGAFRQLQQELRDLLVRSNPQHADRLQSINESYAHLVRIEGAAGRTGTDQGLFTPAQLLSAVRQGDKSARKNEFARGGALMQDLGDSAQSVMGNKVPDSGTPYRSLLALGAAGGTGLIDPTTALIGAGTLGAYSRPGVGLLEHLIARRPPGAQTAASLLRLPAVTAPLGGLLAQFN